MITMLLMMTLALFAVSHAADQDLRFISKDPASTFEEAWTDFKAEYNKNYESLAEEYYRQKIFEENLNIIESHNNLYDLGLKTYRMGINHLSDMNSLEVLDKMTGLEMSDNMTEDGGTIFLPPSGVDIPRTVDWRKRGYVTRVKDQGQCGSCWAFSATGSLEGQMKKKTGNLVSLSEQNLLDCTRKYGNHGCNGGNVFRSFQYIKDNKGIDTEKGYPYEEQERTCRYNRQLRGATVNGYLYIEQGSEEKLKQAVATIGPISVYINVKSSFYKYKSGIYYERNCDPWKINHAVLVVGYGRERRMDYWIVKNSWGSDFGEQGYIRMARNKGNLCGVASYAIYPLV